MKSIVKFLLLSYFTITITASPIREESENIEITILHNNDIHGRFEQTDKNGGPCYEDLAKNNQCYGGMARTAHIIRRYRNESERNENSAVLYFNAGDIFAGTVWFQIFKDKISSEFLNHLQPDAVTLGNHEFDFGLKTLKKYLLNINFPVLVSNLDISKEPELAEVDSLHKSKIFDIKGIKIGVLGYLTPETMIQSTTGNLYINPEIPYVTSESKKLKNAGADFIIALGHSGFEMDKKIASICPDIDLVIGGHTDTFLFNGNPPDIEMPRGPYPVVIEQTNGKKVLVVQASCFTKYIGALTLKFNSNHKLIEWNGNSIILDSTIPQDKDILEILEAYRPNVTALSVVIGSTKVVLNGTKAACRKGECNFGNLVADAILYARNEEMIALNKNPDTFVSITQAGGIKTSISNITNGGDIQLYDIILAFPYKNDLYVVPINGDRLMSALELSANNYDAIEDGGFLQYSGIKVIYDMSKPIGQRLIKAEIKIDNNHHYERIENEKFYNIVMNKFLLQGGDGYKWTNTANPLSDAIKMNSTNHQALLNYIKIMSPLKHTIEGRQIILGSSSSSSSPLKAKP